jgi:Na+/melibiose symporter-like transporter
MLAAAVLAAIGFPEDVARITPEILRHLGISYVAVILMMGAASMTALWTYRITRREHEVHVAELQAREAVQPPSTSPIAKAQ